jgi:hypothetical protein
MILFDIQLRKTLHDPHCLHAHFCNPQEKLHRIGGVIHGLVGPQVGVVDDAAGWILGYGLALQDPLQSGLAVDDVVVGFQGYPRVDRPR